MKILVIGGGGREHALVWRLRQSPQVEKIWCAPGNGGIAEDAECLAVNAGDVDALLALAQQLRPDLTVVGPELPLVAGIADLFAQHGLRLIGPSQANARLEGSKIFAKQFMERRGIPTARRYGCFDAATDARAALDKVKWPAVLKADGLCAGKGVMVAQTRGEAEEFIERALVRREFGEGGARVLMEEALAGEELSFIVLTDGHAVLPMVCTRDHKRVFDGDSGPNTGGMGAYSCDEMISAELASQILARIVRPTIEGLRADGTPYSGFLYFGLMLAHDGPKVLEYNCRLGDPEAQAIVSRMDFDLAAAFEAVASGKLENFKAAWKQGASVCVVMASEGYPGKFASGKAIKGLTEATAIPGVVIFHAGTKIEAGSLVTSGGRVLGVTATDATLGDAIRRAYIAAARIHFDGAHYRRDIGAAAAAKRIGAAGRALHG